MASESRERDSWNTRSPSASPPAPRSLAVRRAAAASQPPAAEKTSSQAVATSRVLVGIPGLYSNRPLPSSRARRGELLGRLERGPEPVVSHQPQQGAPELGHGPVAAGRGAAVGRAR